MRLGPSKLGRVGYEMLIWTAGLVRAPWATAVWDRAWSAASLRLSGPVVTRIHGRRVVVNAGYAYPAFARRWPTYNDPLVELVHVARQAKGTRLTVVDVGAAVGDTVLLLLEKCPGDVERFHCVEGDAEFSQYLDSNLGGDEAIALHFVMLSDADGEEAALVRTHSGTASAQGAGRQLATTLDSILAEAPAVDVLKVDTDGFDGKVLAGATEVLKRHRPAVIFEWHPLLYRATGQDWRRPFEVLVTQDYRWFVWFTKEGEFSHVDDGYRPASVAVLADVCLTESGPRQDWHYDVVVLPEGSAVDPREVAALRHARSFSRAGWFGATRP